MSRRITASAYFGRPLGASLRPSPGVDRLSHRLKIEPRAVHRLARLTQLDLHWLDVVTSPEVTTGRPASWDACIALGVDPLTGEDVA